MPAPLAGATNTIIARLFVRELDARGIDSDAALAAVGLTRELVNDPNGVIGWAQHMRFACDALELARSDDFAVLAGGRAELTDMDLAGLYLRSSANGREAFQFHCENREVFEPSALTRIHTTASALVIAVVPQPRTRERAALAECLFASALKIIPELAGPVAPLEARFRHARPARDGAHLRVFGRVCFESDIDALFLPIEMVDRPWPHRDDTTRAVLEPHVARQRERVQAACASDLPTRVLYGIREELADGRTGVDSLAKRLRMSPRSLRRGLSVLGTSYSCLLAQARRELAEQHALEQPRQSGPDIARLLGYAEPHTFYRAFKRWTGTSLSEYRKHASHD